MYFDHNPIEAVLFEVSFFSFLFFFWKITNLLSVFICKTAKVNNAKTTSTTQIDSVGWS
jgi:hypothetical protein